MLEKCISCCRVSTFIVLLARVKIIIRSPQDSIQKIKYVDWCGTESQNDVGGYAASGPLAGLDAVNEGAVAGLTISAEAVAKKVRHLTSWPFTIPGYLGAFPGRTETAAIHFHLPTSTWPSAQTHSRHRMEMSEIHLSSGVFDRARYLLDLKQSSAHTLF